MGAEDARNFAPSAGHDGVSVSRNPPLMRRFRYLSLGAIFGVSFWGAAVNEIQRRRAGLPSREGCLVAAA